MSNTPETKTETENHEHGQIVVPPENKITKPDSKVTAVSEVGLVMTNLSELWQFAVIVAKSGMAPKGMNTEGIFLAVQNGYEIGLTPMVALQNSAVINGRVGIFGDAALALVRRSGLLGDDFTEEEIGTRGKDDWGYRITGSRKGCKPSSETFTVEDAKQAKLWGKDGPWSTAPKRMLKFRARSFWLRDNFGDVLKGLHTVEELADTEQARFEAAKPANVTVAPIVPENASKSDKIAAKISKPKAEAEPAPAPTHAETPEKQTDPAPTAPSNDDLTLEEVRAKVRELQQEFSITDAEIAQYARLQGKANARATTVPQLNQEALELVVKEWSTIVDTVVSWREAAARK